MKRHVLTSCLAASLPALLAGCSSPEPSATGQQPIALLTPPRPCPVGVPTCAEAEDRPEPEDLTEANSGNIGYSGTAVRLLEGSGFLPDEDGDTIPDVADDCSGPGWREPCDGDASDDGLYVPLQHAGLEGIRVTTEITTPAADIRPADLYILMDTTESMASELPGLREGLIHGDMVDPAQCPDAAGHGLVGAMRCVVPDLRFGLGQFDDYPIDPYGNPFAYAPYHHHLDMTADRTLLDAAVSRLVSTASGERDFADAASQALYSVVSGMGLGPWVPNRAPCPDGGWGYPCFRGSALPIIMTVTDSPMHNGPLDVADPYDPEHFLSLGLSAELPPLEQHPGMLQSNNRTDAHDLGDLSGRSLSVMGTTALHENSFFSSEGQCAYCPDDPGTPCTAHADCGLAPGICDFDRGICDPPSCWTDGRDAAVSFSLSSAVTDATLSSEGSFFPATHVALFGGSDAPVDCDPGPGAGNYWGSLTTDIPVGDWYLVADAKLSPEDAPAERRGPYQLRIATTPPEPSWRTADSPVRWDAVASELANANVKMISVVGDGWDVHAAEQQLQELAVTTGSVDEHGNALVEHVAWDGSDLGTSTLDALRILTGDTRGDVSIAAEDNPDTPGVDESLFTGEVLATSCPTTGLGSCSGGQLTSTCTDCWSGTTTSFEVAISNDFVLPTGAAQVFELELVSRDGDGTEISRLPLRIAVPPSGEGFYQNTYDASTACQIPPERPNWGLLTWNGEIPPGTSLEFEIFANDDPENLDSTPAVSVLFDDGTAMPASFDVGTMLDTAPNVTNYLTYLRVRARLRASSDGLRTPSLESWRLEWDCIPFE